MNKMFLKRMAVALCVASALVAQGEVDRDVLKQLMKDTWTCLDSMMDESTGFPQDTQKKGGHTNTTNLGLYLASLCCAAETGLTTREHGGQRAEKILQSLESYQRMHGFMPHIIEVDLRERTAHGIMAVSDFNKLAVGLVMVRQTWPELSGRITAFLDAIEWSRLYHSETGLLSWGYDFDRDAPTGAGRLWLTADTRSAVFMMVATEAAPPEVWVRMERQTKKTPFGRILRGYGMGGLFLHAMDGLFLPESDTEVGESAGNLAWQQIQLAQKRGYPFWGWSNCYMPGKGYTEGGYLSEHVVTPHAIALMLDYYPRHATAALREMVKRGGTVPPAGYEGKAWGLRDALDMRTGQWDEHYLSLDQGMLFLALMNHLHDGLVRRIYASDPLVQNGLKLLEPHIQHDPSLRKVWEKRDAMPWKNRIEPASVLPSVCAVPLSDFHSSDSARLQIKQEGGAALLDYIAKGSTEPIQAEFTFSPVDLSSLSVLELDLEVSASVPADAGHLRLHLLDQYGQARYAHFKLDPNRKTYRIATEDLLGIHIDETAATRLHLVFWRNPWFYQSKRLEAERCQLKLNALRFVRR